MKLTFSLGLTLTKIVEQKEMPGINIFKRQIPFLPQVTFFL